MNNSENESIVSARTGLNVHGTRSMTYGYVEQLRQRSHSWLRFICEDRKRDKIAVEAGTPFRLSKN